MLAQSRTLRRTPLAVAFGVLLWLAAAWSADAAPILKTVTVGPSRVIRTAHGPKLRPQLAVADRIIVRLAPGAADRGGQALARVKGRFSKHLGRGSYVVQLPAGTDVVAAAAALRGQPGVAVAAPDLLMQPALIPDDTHYGDQWHLPIISAPAAWDVYTGSSNVVVAIVDSGADLDHPDLAAKIWRNPDEIADNGRDDDGNGYVDDVNGWDFYDENNNPNPSPDGVGDDSVNHGTMVAGLVGAVGNDGWGTAGMDWGARLMALQVFPDDGDTSVSIVIEAINYATANGAHIINLSVGGGYTDAFTAPITDAYNAGILVVAAGGNSGDELTDREASWESPVCNDGGNPLTENHVLGVGSTDRNDVRSWFSNYDGSSGQFIDVMAPGDEIYGLAAYFPEVRGFNTYFGTNSGTSFSCPIVTGLAALIKGLHPSWSPTQLMAAIAENADSIDGSNPGYAGMLGGGRINCARALGVTLPPASVQDLTAVDTASDDGGSVTVTWRLSADDAAVTEYQILRREGATGDFTQVAAVAAGVATYADTSVTDGVDYYYKVRTTDGVLSSETAVVGPVRSRNDGPPPVLANVRATDRPADRGGALVLSWDTYTAPADFAAFAIYRSTRTFQSVLGMTPVITLANDAATGYTDSQISDGVDYYYAVGVRDTAGNEVRTLSAFGPVQSYSNTTVDFAAGLHFLAVPTIPADADPATLLGLPAGSFQFMRWNTGTNTYDVDMGGRPLPDALALGLGRGYWLRLNEPVSINPAGIAAPAGDFDIALTPGWHQIGNPFFSTIDFAEATVTYEGATMDLASADGGNILAAYAWTYDVSTGAYAMVYPPLGGTRLVQPWQGLWVLAYRDCVLTIARPLGTQSAALRPASAATRRAASLDVDWTVSLRVRAGRTLGNTGVVGAASRQLLAPQPPPVGDAPVLKLAAPGPADAGNYAVSLAQSGQTNIIWNMKVENLRPGQEVQVSAPDLSALPRDAVVLLEDLATSRTVYLRTVSQYSFTPRAGEMSRSLRLSVAPRSAGMLAVQGVSAQAVRAGGAAVCFTLSSPASCTVTVLNMAGRPVRVLEEEKARPAGNQSLLWDGRSGAGTLVPSGMYLLQVNANGSSGENVRAMSTFRIQR